MEEIARKRKYQSVEVHLREGSEWRIWNDAIVEIHPDHPPRIHYFDARGTVEITAFDAISSTGKET